MKLLFDENLPQSLTRHLADLFPESGHVVSMGLAAADDLDVWNYAKQNNFTIVTKDSDFHDVCAIRGAPPKIVWLRVGNCSIVDLVQILRAVAPDIQALDQDEDAAELMVNRPRDEK